MLSPEGEKVGLGKGLKARGNVEDWLGKVEEAMVISLRRTTKHALADLENRSREEWLQDYPSQVRKQLYFLKSSSKMCIEIS